MENSRRGSPINRGQFVTRLARSYCLLTQEMIATLTRGRAKNLIISFLETMRVVELVRGVYVSPAEDQVEFVEKAEGSSQRGR